MFVYYFISISVVSIKNISHKNQKKKMFDQMEIQLRNTVFWNWMYEQTFPLRF